MNDTPKTLGEEGAFHEALRLAAEAQAERLLAAPSRSAAAVEYRALLAGVPLEDVEFWRDLNARIIERWSERGLRTIKNEAWKR